jgi:hypothetical protein
MMSKRLVDRISFAKILIGFAVCAFISLGLCGVDAVYEMRMSEQGKYAMQHLFSQLGVLGLVGIVVSVLGLFFTALVWMILIIVKSFRSPEV